MEIFSSCTASRSRTMNFKTYATFFAIIVLTVVEETHQSKSEVEPCKPANGTPYSTEEMKVASDLYELFCEYGNHCLEELKVYTEKWVEKDIENNCLGNADVVNYYHGLCANYAVITEAGVKEYDPLTCCVAEAMRQLPEKGQGKPDKDYVIKDLNEYCPKRKSRRNFVGQLITQG